MKRTAVFLVLVLAACSGSGPAKRSGDRPPAVTLLAQNINLFPGDARAVRIGFEPAAPASFVRIEFRPSSAHVGVCPLTSLEQTIARAGCRSGIGSGVREPVSVAGMRALAFVLDGSGDVTADIRIEYDEAGRDVSVRLPLMRAPAAASVCKDNGCNPFFEILPVRGGSFSARATWSGPPATLVLLQGSVRGRSQTSTGIPYRDAARADGSSPLQISTRLVAPAEYALALRQDAGPASTALSDVAIDATWP